MLARGFRKVLPSTLTPRQPLRRPNSTMGAGTQTVNTTERLAALRKFLAQEKVNAFVVPSEDQHSSEYLAACDERRAFISGFNGSAGCAVVTEKEAYLFTDGRYFLQAEQQLDKNWTLMRRGQTGVPTWQDFLSKNLDASSRIGIDPTLISATDAETITKALAPKSSSLVSLGINPVDSVWSSERPARPKSRIVPLATAYSGESHASKLARLREELAKREPKADAMVVSMLDEVAWLFNLRGADIAYNPVFFAYAVVTMDKATLFVDPAQLDADARAALGEEVLVRDYASFFGALKELSGLKVLLGDNCSLAVAEALGSADNYVLAPSPIAVMKAIKNDTELEGFRQSHIRDGAALARYFAWLEEQLLKGVVLNESQAADQLEAYRKELDRFVGLSFPTISSTGPNGAIIHYCPDANDCATVKLDQVSMVFHGLPYTYLLPKIYLCDSGAQFLDGTTDVTRTWHFGEPTAEEKRAFTRVLQGHIAIDTAIFPTGTTGYLLDPFARKFLWQDGLDYRHGTGHGVGHYLNVHEGPHGIGVRINYNATALKPGMTVSNEPGYYADGRFGIRIENVVLVRSVATPNNFDDKGFLGFEHVTMCPIQTKLIERELISEEERKWVNAYHEEVLGKVGGLVREMGDERAAPEEHAAACDRCGALVRESEQQRHLQRHLKLRRQLFADVESMAAETEEDKNSVSVSHKESGVDFGVVGVEETLSVDITVEKAGTESIVLETLAMRSFNSRFSASLAGQKRWVTHVRARTICVRFDPTIEGDFRDVLELVFLNVNTRERFLITRKVLGVAGSKDDHELLKPKSAYSRRPRAIPVAFSGPIVKSLRPPTWGPNTWKSKLLAYEPPADLVQVAFGEPRGRDLVRAAQRFLPPVFNATTYARHFQTLLFIEDYQMRLNLEMYNMTDVELTPHYPRYHLQVEGLEEGRPSVVVGDFIRLRHTGVEDGPWYEGRVHQVHQKHLSLRFGDNFSTYRGTKFDVRFTLNRLPLRRMHQALTNASNQERILFPTVDHMKGKRNVRRCSEEQIAAIVPVNRLVAEDREQLETVAAIVNRPRGTVPFVIFGPPGTGKTMTIVEAINQLLLRHPNARILACAPSNSAADLIAQRLSPLGAMTLLRLNSLTREYEKLPKDLLKFSASNDNKTFVLPPLEELAKFRVVVATCLSGGVPAQMGVKRGFYTHIFIDEAGQATEPEVMLPIKSLVDKDTNIVLAGDDKQLGPVVQSGLAGILGLKLSYLSRIMQREVYSLAPETAVGGRGINIVKLVNNFRSHPAILEFSNTQFYDGELRSCGNPALIRSLENSDELPKKKFPLLFHGIAGRDQREGFSPSFFNIDEASIVRRYIGSLLSNHKLRLRAEDIGVITPYHAQRCKINLLLSKEARFKGVTVGSVEEFQGQERRVIIMSTVRSNTNYVESDVRRTLGFVANPQRFNVAVTRAQALLIVVGNPDVLALDPLWRAFMNYVYSRGGWRGKPISWNPEEPVESSADAYEREMQNRADGDAEETMARLRALIMRRNEGSDLGSDLELDFSDDEGPGGGGRTLSRRSYSSLVSCLGDLNAE
ncbi:RNA helicase [Mycena kentingensis (nom. inval.)]|nr:RNA helicase [Mycena kentingensis (nom. inval.)]